MTSCGEFIIYYFGQNGNYVENITISNIYYHIWQKIPESPFEGELFDWGYYTEGGHNAHLNESIIVETNQENAISTVENYRLFQFMQYTNTDIAEFQGNEIFNFTIKAYGNGPNVITSSNQCSFIYINLEENSTLMNYDRDNDNLSDYEELLK